LLGIVGSKRLNIHKANIDVDTPCDVTIWATCNPVTGIYDINKREYENFGILHPLWNRIDMTLYFNSAFEETKILHYLCNNVNEFCPDPDSIKLFRKYWLYASLLDITLELEDYEKLEKVVSALNIRKSDGFRKIGTMKRLLIGVCRLNHRTKPITEDFKFLSDLIIGLNQSRGLFIEEHRGN
jgi:DNA replicative helicase MCM subunit Mcm2 (Cdc46/Mcm family)